MAEWARKLTDGLYWMGSQTASDSTGVAILDDIAGRFDTVAESLALVQETQGRGKIFEQALEEPCRAQFAARRGCKEWASLTIGTRERSRVDTIHGGAQRIISVVSCARRPGRPGRMVLAADVHRGGGPAAARRHSRFPGLIASAIIQNGSRIASKAKRTGRRSSRPLLDWSVMGCPPALASFENC